MLLKDILIQWHPTKARELQNYEESLKQEHEFIASLQLDNKCGDLFPDCKKWAENNDCIINPEFMLKNCPSSCWSCKMTDSQKQQMTNIYNLREPINCVYHGGYSL
jgi:hypothetical protein